MNLKSLARDWAVADRIMNDWLGGAPLSAIDKDLVLEKLRRIYEEVYASDYVEPSHEHEPEPVPMPAPELRDIPVDDMIAAIDEPTVCEYEVEDAKAKIDRRALLSLYDDPAEDAVPPAEPEPVADAPQEPVRVWGEVAGGGEQTIADAYAGSVHDVAAELGSGPVESLREAIGVNDKFRMVRDMFGSDVEAYERAIAEFESFTDLDDAMVYMYENFSWNPDDDSVRMLVDLLTRKLA